MSRRDTLGGTDGVRGIANTGTTAGDMNPRTVFALSLSLAELAMERSDSTTIIVGEDSRNCNRYLSPAAIAGALAAGATVEWLGLSPTPATLRAAQRSKAAAAISMSASHNSAEYGGWKGTLGPDKPYGDEILHISNRAWKFLDNSLAVPLLKKHAMTQLEKREHIRGYMLDAVRKIEEEFGQSPLEDKVFVIDGAQGAAREITPRLFKWLGATVHRFACDGMTPINEECGATDLSGVQKYVLEKRLYADPNFMGVIANDGDGDRIIGAYPYLDDEQTPHLDVIDGNRLLELMAKGQPGVVGTHYTNDASVERIRKAGSNFEFCDNGDVAVTRSLQQHGWRIGGEFSGHLVDREWLSSGDGILEGAWLAAYASRNNVSFHDLAQQLPLYPEKMRKIQLQSNVKNFDRILDNLRRTLEVNETDQAQSFRQITRQSGTEPVIRIWGVGKTQAYVDERTLQIENAVREKLIA